MEPIKAFFQPDYKYAFTNICNPARMTYGARLEKAMNLAGKDRAAVAKELGVSVQSVGQIINSASGAHTAANCMRVARFLRVDPFWLATGEGEPRPQAPAMMAERTALSLEAVRHAMRFDKLTDRQRRTWRTLLMTVRTAATDERVEEHIPTLPAATSKKSKE